MIEWAECAFNGSRMYIYRVCAYQKRDYLCVKSSSSCKRNEFKNGI